MSGPRQNPGEALLAFFAYEHLPPKLQTVSKPLCELARLMVGMLPASAETTVGLRKLLEAKDCFVRAALVPPTPVEVLGGTEPGRGAAA